MSTMDPGKLKVAELRMELISRNLDGRGVKATLVQRLKDALEKELKTALPDTSILETSTEDTQDDDMDQDLEQPPIETAAVPSTEKLSDPHKKSPTKAAEAKVVEPMETTPETTSAKQDQPMEEDLKKSDETDVDETSKTTVENSEAKPAAEELPKGEKRGRSSTSPQRVQRRRSRSPVKENEPEFDAEKVLLSWYDSDLNLYIDKQTLLSAKPFNDGAFGYSWAGARTTHGVKNGKVCYEVKITEELKWDDIIKQFDKKRDYQRSDRRDRRRNDRRGRDSGKKSGAGKTDESKSSDATEKPVQDMETTKSAEDVAVEIKVKEESGNKVDAESKEENNAVVVKYEHSSEIPVKKEDEGSSETVDKETKASPIVKTDDIEPKENGSDVKVEEKQEAMEVEVPTPIIPVVKHMYRCGWSISGTSLQLGEANHSYGFDSHGKFVNNSEFVDYGVTFAVGDVIGAYANIDNEKIDLIYTINGVSQGVAISIPRTEFEEENFALYPHVLSRNFAFEINLGAREEPWFPNPSELADYIYIEAVEDKFQGPLKPAARGDCEVIMMCGLPSSGKSHWVKDILKENSDKTYTIIGTSYLLEKMKVNGKPLKENYKSRWNIVLDRLMKCTNTLVDKAAERRRNFIIDQTNVFPSAQRRKMRLFEGFKRRAVVVVVSDEEQAKRSAQQEAQEGNDVPESALLEMKANMCLPKCCDWLEEVKYVELGEEEAKTIVQKYNAEGKAAGFGGPNRRTVFHDNRNHPYKWNRNSSRRDYRDGRSYQNNRFRSPGGFPDRRSGPGNWNREYRDNRAPRDNRPGGRYDRPIPRDRNPSANYGRNSRPQGGRWQGSGGAWQSGANWGGHQGEASYQNWGQGNWSGQNQWKGGAYGQGYGQGGYGNWNYYGQYANNWQGHK